MSETNRTYAKHPFLRGLGSLQRVKYPQLLKLRKVLVKNVCYLTAIIVTLEDFLADVFPFLKFFLALLKLLAYADALVTIAP